MVCENHTGEHGSHGRATGSSRAARAGLASPNLRNSAIMNRTANIMNRRPFVRKGTISTSRLVATSFLALMASAWLLPSAHASRSLPFYEPFDTNVYSPDRLRLRDSTTLLNGPSSPSGSTMSTYFDRGNTAGSSVNWTNTWEAGLYYPGLVCLNNSGAAAKTGSQSGSSRDAGFVISPTLVFGPGTNIYFSFLLKVTSSPSTTTLFVDTGCLDLCLDPNLKLWITKLSTGDPTTNGLPYAAPLTLNTVYFIVARYTYVDGGAGDHVDLWVDPPPETFGNDLLVPNPDTSVVVAAIGGAGSCSRFDLKSRVDVLIGSGGLVVDEIRGATNWSGVTPPSTLACCPGSGGLKYAQYPDLNNGTDWGASSSTYPYMHVLADDFPCTNSGYITDIHLWGSWEYDWVDTNAVFTLGIWSDIPTNGSGQWFSEPGTNLLWSQSYSYGQYTMCPYDTNLPEPFRFSGWAPIYSSSELYYFCFQCRQPVLPNGSSVE